MRRRSRGGWQRKAREAPPGGWLKHAGGGAGVGRGSGSVGGSGSGVVDSGSGSGSGGKGKGSGGGGSGRGGGGSIGGSTGAYYKRSMVEDPWRDVS